jgi:hypothetical protein
MKIDDVLKGFKIFVTNEEKKILNKLDGVKPLEIFTERERFTIENLIRKSLVSKVGHNKTYMVTKNDN